MGTGFSFPESKAAGTWSYTFTSQYVFIAWCLVKRGDFTVTYTLRRRTLFQLKAWMYVRVLLAMGRSPVKGILPKCLNGLISHVNF